MAYHHVDQAQILTHVASTNEHFKAIGRSIDNINTIALNAMLVSRRAGTSGLGFVAATHQLRKFGQNLEQALHGSARDMHTLVIAACHQSQQQRRQEKYLSTISQLRVEEQHDFVGAICEDLSERRAETLNKLRNLQKALIKFRDKCEQLTGIGDSLAVRAKIEEAAMQNSRHGLRISEELEQKIADILKHLVDIETDLDFAV